jgi:hypothetical protein
MNNREICSFCGSEETYEQPFFKGNNALICHDCVCRFSKRIVKVVPFKKTQTRIEAVFQCPSCGEAVQPTVCPNCKFEWNTEDMTTNLERISRINSVYRWASAEFEDNLYMIGADFNRTMPGSMNLSITLPLKRKSDKYEVIISGLMRFSEKNGDSIEICYDDLLFRR